MGDTKAPLPPSALPADEALAVYCLRPATTSAEELLGSSAYSNILNAPEQAIPFPTSPVRASIVCLGAVLTIGAALWPYRSGFYLIPMIIGLATAYIAGRPWVEWVRARHKDRSEPTHGALARMAENLVQRRNIHALEELRRNVGKSIFDAYCLLPDGSTRHLLDEERACFLADHGRIMIISGDYNRRFAIRARPIPPGVIWIDLNGKTARAQISAKALITEQDADLYSRRVEWIRLHAAKRGITSGSLISGLAIIEAFRDERIANLELKDAIPAIRQSYRLPAASSTIISQMHSGNYKEFEMALLSLPLEDMP
jgi:hypothetical protein